MATFTPNLGLAKPIVDADDDVWGAMLNGNADILDTVFNPLMITATGSTTPRSAQNRAADIVNVLDFGADPTGVADCTAAFNAAIASRPFNNAHVFIPAGRYWINGAVTMGAGCVIYGAGRQMTMIQIQGSFNMSAQGVFVLGSDPAHPGTPTIRDLWIRFAQPNFAGMTRADLIQYPPAIYKAAATLTGRPNFENLMISSAWIGFDLDSCAAYLDNIYMSAFSYGFRWSATVPTLDCVRISNMHFWGFDFNSASPLGLLFMDGTVNCGWFGRVDGLYLVNFFSESSIITVDCGPNPAGGYYFFQQIGLDGPAKLVINSNVNLQLDSISNSRAATAVYVDAGIVINGGRNEIFNAYLASSMTALPMIKVQGGSLSYHGGTAAWVETDTPFMVCSSGVLEVRDVTFATHLGAARTTPIISQTGTGYVMVTGCRFSGFPVTGISPISITNAANAFVDANNYGGMAQTLPTDYLTVSYGNRDIRGDASSATSAQLTLRSPSGANGLESKLRLYGTFGTGGDFGPRLFSQIRSGSTGSWGNGYLDFWITNATNDVASDANMLQVARFTTTTLNLGINVVTQGGNAVAADQYYQLNAAAGRAHNIRFLRAGVSKLVLAFTSGDNFIITCNDDAGVGLFNPFSITRLTGMIGISKGVAISGGASTIDQAVIGATTPAAGTFTSLSLGAQTGANTSDFSKHIALHTGGFGLGITSARMNVITPNTSSVNFVLSGVDRLTVSDTAVTATVPVTAPNHRVGSNQVVGARVTGWGAATGGSKVAFNGATATLPQTSAALAQLIADLTTHGLIGT